MHNLEQYSFPCVSTELVWNCYLLLIWMVKWGAQHPWSITPSWARLICSQVPRWCDHHPFKGYDEGRDLPWWFMWLKSDWQLFCQGWVPRRRLGWGGKHQQVWLGWRSEPQSLTLFYWCFDFSLVFSCFSLGSVSGKKRDRTHCINR